MLHVQDRLRKVPLHLILDMRCIAARKISWFQSFKSYKKLQIRAARIVTNSSYDAPAANLIKELRWPTVHNNMIKQETATIVSKSINDLAP